MRKKDQAYIKTSKLIYSLLQAKCVRWMQHWCPRRRPTSRVLQLMADGCCRNDVPVEYSGEEQAICAVGIVQPRPGVFMAAIQHILVLCTTVEVQGSAQHQT